jgi:DNA polymerase-3 subunit delta
MGAGFAATERFLSDVRENKLRPGYVLIGDEIFLYERCRKRRRISSRLWIARARRR